jgi:hypothetical protein
MVPHVERSRPETCETPLHAFIRTTIAQASHAICDMLATNAEIMGKSCRGEGRHSQRVPCVTGSVECIAAVSTRTYSWCCGRL